METLTVAFLVTMARILDSC